MKVKKLASGRYQVRWRDDAGVQRARNFRTKELASDFVSEFDSEQFELPREVLTFRELAERWISNPGGFRGETTKVYDRIYLDLYLLPYLGDVRVDRLRKRDLLEVQGKLKARVGVRGRPLSAGTVNLIVRMASSIMRLGVEWEVLKENPFARVRSLPVLKKAVCAWTQDERDKFLRFCRSRDPEFAELVAVACHSGLRLGELAALTRGQLDFGARLIRVDASYSAKVRKRLPRSKNGEIGFVPMNDVVLGILRTRTLMASDGLVFSRGVFRNRLGRLKRLCVAAGVSVIRFHGLRHTYASTLVTAGVSLYSVQKLMRHKSISQTEVYAHLAPDHLLEACARIVHSSGKASVNG